jgi:HD superfamily phosphodiesterase
MAVRGLGYLTLRQKSTLIKMGSQSNNWEKWIPILEAEIVKSLSKARKANRQGHGLDHLRRVWRTCLHLGTQLEADLEILVAAAYLHDLGILQKLSPKHGMLSAELAKPVLDRIGFPEAKKARTLHAIGVHDITFFNRDRDTLESKILYDADKSESLGVIGVLRYIVILYHRKSIDYILQDLEKRWQGLCLAETKALKKSDYEYTRHYFQELNQLSEKTFPLSDASALTKHYLK